jgi:predicted dehydrogenase
MVRFGILGTGWIVRKYAEACRLLPGLELAAVASRDGDRARALAGQLGIARAHAGYATLLADPDLDVVINALHNGLHCEWSIRALQAGKHVLCEKPLACNSVEATQMFAAAHAQRRWLMEGFMYRFHPHIIEALRRVKAGAVGRVLHIRSARVAHGRDRDNLRYRREAGGGALLDIGCYCVNLSRAVAGEPTRVTAHAHFDEQTDVDLTLAGTLIFERPNVAALVSSAEPAAKPNDPRFAEARLQPTPAETITAQFVCSFEGEPTYSAEIIGTEGRLTIPHPWMPPAFPNEIILHRNAQSETVRVEDPAAPGHVLAPFALELAHFADCVRQNRPPVFPPDTDAEQDARGNARVLEALLASARTSQPVVLAREQ